MDSCSFHWSLFPRKYLYLFFFIELSTGRERTGLEHTIFACCFINSILKLFLPSLDFYLLII